jgi:hypothetical protein
MKVLRSVVLGLILVLALFTTALYATGASPPEGEVKPLEVAAAEKPAEDKVTGNGTLGIFNKYIFRGYEIGRGSVVLQPSLTASYKGFSVSFWGNIDTDAHGTQNYYPDAFGKEGQKWFNETDLTLSYTYNLGKVALTGGYIYYNLKYAEETEEFFLGASADIISKPTLTIYQDITSYPGTYINLSLGHSFELFKEKGITFDVAASGSYMSGQGKYWRTYDTFTKGYTGNKYSAFHAGMVQGGFTIPVTKAFVFQPIIQYWFPLSNDAKNSEGPVGYNPNGYVGTNLVYGANFTYNF